MLFFSYGVLFLRMISYGDFVYIWIDCQRDQWQALEGLAGVALYRGDMNRAVSCYQKAVGICAAVGNNTQEQDRLVRKLSSVLRSRAQRNGGNGVHHPQPGMCSVSSASSKYLLLAPVY